MATTGVSTTTLTAPRQSSQLLELLRSVLQDSVRELRRYLAIGGESNARVYQDPQRGNFHVSSEDYTGPGIVREVSLLTMCCYRKWREQIGLLIGAGADPGSDAGSYASHSPMCTAAGM